MPPTRYRVVERGRRLVVIDREDPGAVFRASPPEMPSSPPPGRAMKALAPARSNGSTPGITLNERGDKVIQTARWFDDKGPRRITLVGYHTQKLLKDAQTVLTIAAVIYIVGGVFLPLIYAVPLALAFKPARVQARGWLTRWFDALDQASLGDKAG